MDFFKYINVEFEIQEYVQSDIINCIYTPKYKGIRAN